MVQMPATSSSGQDFYDLPRLLHFEVDRFCEGCGYNLRGQVVRREPGTKILLARCPECGCFHPAADAGTVGLLPRSLRPALGHLWRADGKTPPRPPAPTG